jgi:phospholipid N-methyltransferase
MEFLKAAIQKPREVSTLFPTGGFLARALIEGAELPKDKGLVVELGAGTGAITKPLIQAMSEDLDYLGVEINKGMVRFLRKTFPELHFEEARADQIEEFMAGRKASRILSSLPWTILPPPLREETLQAVYDALEEGGIFSMYMCLNSSWYPSAKHFRKQLEHTFAEVNRGPTVWANMPPAFILQCKK